MSGPDSVPQDLPAFLQVIGPIPQCAYLSVQKNSVWPQPEKLAPQFASIFLSYDNLLTTWSRGNELFLL